MQAPPILLVDFWDDGPLVEGCLAGGKLYVHINNDLRPCPLIDHPGAMAGLVEEYSAYPTHEGAESLFGEFIPHLREYARNVAQIYKKVWDEEYKWVYDWRHQKSKE
ncbi:MAG: hypothetical protein QME54_01310 [Actinomycetota bacterium]|nr:hypothetical protein [Actinomycetota bacterium]